ncbi:MAG: hypothetical protein JXB60_04175 [Candidatus Cloacimonetes bacterium]|nr:hypothetical protein [Candidatus Cloacimonadota bacterium]
MEDTSIASRFKDLKEIEILLHTFGKQACTLIEKYHFYKGYQAGIRRLLAMIAEDRFDLIAFTVKPRVEIRNFLAGFFNDRGGNQPEIWLENTTIFLKTPGSRECITLEAEKKNPVPHQDICFIYCRSFALGLISIFADLIPGLKVSHYNISSRRLPGGDCVEAFQIVVA